MARISSLQPNSTADLEATITAISPARQVQTFRGPSQVAEATLQDESGTVTLTLWGPDITRYQPGQKVRITGGWVKQYRGKLQVSQGRNGRIEVVSASP
jgi:replication factor A1